MKSPEKNPVAPEEARPPAWRIHLFFWGGLFVALLLYAQTYRTPWVYDDIEGIRDNPALKPGASFAEILHASPADSTPYGRPLVVLSLAANHALSGFSPWSYRAFNLALHLGTACLLYDLLRRCLRVQGSPTAEHAEPVARWSALLFAVHPLATTVVTYTVQRAEGLMAFFYLGTLAASARALGDSRSRAWPLAALTLCACGMASKETMVTAPLAVLLLHRFCFAAAWQEVGGRWRWHLGLAATWGVLAACMLTWPRRQSVGFEGMGALDYLNLQTGAWWHYLGLIFAPGRSAIDYWPQPAASGTALGAGLLFAALYLGAIFWAWRRSRVLALGLALPGLLLLPTSTVVPIFTSPVADHRMYLPAAFALAIIVAGGFTLVGPRHRALLAAAFALCAGGLALATVGANRLYRSESALWANAVQRDAGNARAWNNLGMALADAGEHESGETKIKHALQLQPAYADAWYNLGTLQGRDGRLASAEESFRRALALRPSYAAAHCNLAVVLYRRGRADDAIAHYQEAIRFRPGYPAANFNLALCYMERGDYPRAHAHALACLNASPDYPKARELVADLVHRMR